MVSTSTYILDVKKKDSKKVKWFIGRYRSSHIAIIDKKQSATMARYTLAISQEALNALDNSLKNAGIERKFYLL